MPLTPQQEQVLALISAGSTVSDAARSAGIHRNTIHNWLRSAVSFRLALAQAREDKALYWREQAEQLAAAAIETIRALMADPKAPAAVRLKAAQTILNLAITPSPGFYANGWASSERLHNSAQPMTEVESAQLLPAAPNVHKPAQVNGWAPSENLHNSAQPMTEVESAQLLPAAPNVHKPAQVNGWAPSENLHNSAQPMTEVESAQLLPAAPNVHKPAQFLRRTTPKTGRKDLCRCGSGKKFKRCCLENAAARAAA